MYEVDLLQCIYNFWFLNVVGDSSLQRYQHAFECVFKHVCPGLWSFSLDCVDIWLAVVPSHSSFPECIFSSTGVSKCSMSSEVLFLLQSVLLFVSGVHLLFQ